MLARLRSSAIVAALALLLVPMGAVTAQTIIHVDLDAAPGGDGTSWTTAFADLQAALDAAMAPASTVEQIWVAEGMYTPSAPLAAGDPRSSTFALRDDLAIYGGFEGTETDLAARDWIAHETILSGDLAGDDGPDFASNGENVYHILWADEVVGAVVDGFILVGGNAFAPTASREEWYGAGLHVSGGSVAVRHCTFRQGSAYRGGGGVRIRTGFTPATITLEGCRFEGNRTTDEGGGALDLAIGSQAQIEGCSFIGNEGADLGGAINVENSVLTISACEFFGNSSIQSGGAVAALGSSSILLGCTFEQSSSIFGSGSGVYSDEGSLRIVDCSFTDGSADNRGGAVWHDDVLLEIWNARFVGNQAGDEGGAIYCEAGNHPIRLHNCLIAGNSSGGPGGAVAVSGADATIGTSTIWGNSSSGLTAGLWITGAGRTFEVRNCLLWQNVGIAGSTQDRQFSADGGAAFDVSWATVEGWTGRAGGTMVTTADPLLVDADGHLGPGSPALDQGNAASLPADLADLDGDGDVAEPLPIDLDGAPRVVGSTVDLGSYEGSVPCPAPLTTDCNSNQVPDECEADCNGNGVVDECDIAQGTSTDGDGDGVPAECEPDCNGNLVEDGTDILTGTSTDCDANGVPDECQPAEPWLAFTSADSLFPPGAFATECVDIDGDTIVVGISDGDTFGSNTGQVLVLERIGGDWIVTQELGPSQPSSGAGFGVSLALHEDRLVVGAVREPGGTPGNSAGAAYVFERVGGSFAQVAQLQPPVPELGSNFGSSVGLDGDLAVVGAGAYGNDQGRVFVFRRDGVGWLFEDSLVPADVEPGDFSGRRIAIAGEWIVAHSYDDTFGSLAGAVYVFRNGVNGWEEFQKLAPIDLDAGDEFGRELDVLGSGWIAAGAPGQDEATANSGTGYLFRFDGASWVQDGKVRPSVPPPGYRFGSAVGLTETPAGPVALFAVVRGTFGSPPVAGQVYSYHRAHSQWLQASVLQGSPDGVQDAFGTDLGGDGNRIVVGVPQHFGNSGRFHVYHGVGLPDCNENGIHDLCELDAGLAFDCNGNQVLDVCDTLAGYSADRDGDTVPDECPSTDEFIRGDANADAVVDIADPVWILATLFTSGPAPPCVLAADGNDDDQLDVGDPIFLLAHLFVSGASMPPPPFPSCGQDPTPDPALPCGDYGHCP